MDHFICELQIDDLLNEEEIESVVDLALEAVSDGQSPHINMGYSIDEVNGQIKFDIFKDFWYNIYSKLRKEFLEHVVKNAARVCKALTAKRISLSLLRGLGKRTL